MKTKTIKLISRWVVILIILIGASCVAVGIVQANAQDSLSGALMLGFELDNLPVERLSERDAVDAEGTHYGLISTGGNALIHYTGYYNTIENKYVHLTDPAGEPQITGDYLNARRCRDTFRERSIRFQAGSQIRNSGAC